MAQLNQNNMENKQMNKGFDRNGLISLIGLFITIVSFIIQAIPQLPEKFKYAVLIGTIASILIILLAYNIYKFINRNVCNRKKLILRGKKIISNAKQSIIFFGGDLSWIDDYYNVIDTAINGSKLVEVYFPKIKYEQAPPDNKLKLKERLTKLKNIGVKIYCLDDDVNLRCIMVDSIDTSVAFVYDNFKLFTAQRIKTNLKKQEKNKYVVNILSYSNVITKDICQAFLTNYSLIKKTRCDLKDFIKC